MLTQVILWGGVALEALVILRGARGKLWRCYPIFYLYLSFVLLETVSLSRFYRTAPQLYAYAYWTCQFIALVLGSLLLFEIYRVALRPYPGTARVARNLLFLVFALTFAKVLVNQSLGAYWWPATTTAELERNLRVVQAVGVLAILFVIFLYRIPRGRHLKGILAGYGLFVASSIVELSFLSYLGDSFQQAVVYLVPMSYLLVLGIWTVALWSPLREPNRSPASLEMAAADHGQLVSRTREELQNIRLDLPGAVRR